MKSIIALLLLLVVAIYSDNGPQFQVVDLNWKYYSMVYTSIPGTILVIDDKSVLQKSVNSGKSWNPVKTDAGTILGNANIISDGIKNENILVIHTTKVGQAINTTLSVSTDGGQTFKQTFVPYQLGGISVNPSEPKTLIAKSSANILISEDFGSTWTDVSNGRKLYKQQSIFSIYTTPEWDPKNPKSFFSILDNGVINGVATGVLSVTTDLGKTQKSLINGAVDMIYTKNYFYVAVIDSKLGNQLWVRSNFEPAQVGNTDGFLLCEFPFGDEVQINDFRILDDSAGAIYMGIQVSVDGESTTSVSGHVYISNSLGNIFTLTLKHVAVSHGLYDFMPIYGAPGAFLFNGVTNTRAAPGAPITVRSYITYDNGGRWSRLSKPSTMDCTIQKDCALNVHGLSAYLDQTRGYGPFYTIANAPGLVVATGNANPALSSSPKVDRIKTVLSTDNGQTWRKIAEYGSIYEFGAFGSTLIYASAMQDTNTVMYSFDQGVTSKSIDLPASYDIINIITNPNNNNNQFLLLVEDRDDTAKVIFVDLTPVQPRYCIQDDLMSMTLNCVLGQKKSYNVIKPGTQCTLNAAPVNTKVDICECTADDFECDIGYESPNPIDGSASNSDSSSEELKCILDPDSKYVPVDSKTCTPGQNYTIPNGFRKVAGSQCIGGVSSKYQPKTAICGSPSKLKGKGWVAAVVIIILFVGLGGFGFYVYKNPDFKQKLKKMVGLSKDTKYSVVGIKPNSLADDEFGIEDDDAQILNDNDLQEDNF
ncbi:hypothetical protein DICPUDRAFT_54835 [Dictyostelium purpureum]|uniref:VPS10 domain-containing protein n=1 Tax=Dictyostelium purpureum TaxID=5786 RepID=F0ZJ45_DICPU|nr:uncharacterized protein DICPUDRAFT_54835 [Dictyostelium purpureum]EGC36064.1 hypothetical protein DICPUDRAFT_54835 [Dictyostelium purpureum]|eukprot:XP_003287439.1 hypothetical protein DICPUDRAFT_54835 [Dictyostelium purpureum]